MLVVLFASAQGTAALWRAEGQLQPGTVTTGSLALTAGDGVSSAQDFPFAGLNASALLPGGYTQAPLVLSNAGSVDLGYTLAGAVSQTPSPTPADNELAARVQLIIFAVAGQSSCTPTSAILGTPLYTGPLLSTAAFSQRRTLTAQGSPAAAETLCVRLALPANAPQAAAGGRVALVLSWRGEQQ
ncbi:hypothetical protein CVS30_14470 [Arthrobacter psychrolactophilus]|uniref:Uncharacterized protein n=1 Tax=Arthrobacter psychrolactophilus TaxID=92442 RepID=A0A2V5IQD2_9MICC|nr:hypothetical protein CVS30_14470 [Arthrobacter psychrolactophilus]